MVNWTDSVRTRRVAGLAIQSTVKAFMLLVPRSAVKESYHGVEEDLLSRRSWFGKTTHIFR